MENCKNHPSIPALTLSNGDRIPVIGMGTFGSDHCPADQVAMAVEGAIQCGYRLFDCASVYGNEGQIGDVLQNAFKAGIVKRDDVFIMSKVWNDMHGQGDVLLSLARTLRDLKLSAIDAYFVHWPFPNYHAPHCGGDSRNPDSKPFSTEEFMSTWRQMEHIYDMGLARHLGMSNMTIPKLEAVLPLCRIRPTFLEAELHPSFQQPELRAYCAQQNIQLIGYCPIGSPHRPERDKTPQDVVDTQLPEVVEIANKHGLHPVSVCLKWAIQSQIIPIPFSVNTSHYQSNLLSAVSNPLTEEEMAYLSQADRNCRLIKGQVFLWPGATSWHDLWDEDGTITGMAT